MGLYGKLSIFLQRVRLGICLEWLYTNAYCMGNNELELKIHHSCSYDFIGEHRGLVRYLRCLECSNKQVKRTSEGMDGEEDGQVELHAKEQPKCFNLCCGMGQSQWGDH